MAVTPLNCHLLTFFYDLSISGVFPTPPNKKQTEKSLPVSLISVTHNDTVHKAHQALERCTNSKEEKEVVQKVCHTHASHGHGTRGHPPLAPHAQLVPLEQFFINKI